MRTSLLLPGAVVIAHAPRRRHVDLSARSPFMHAQPRRLSASEREPVLALAPNHTLRELAADFGVSHETLRAVVRQKPVL